MILYYGGEDYREYDREGVQWVDSLKQVGDIKNIDILVLFSEPTDDDYPLILKMDMNRVLAHEGIHLDCIKFRTKEMLYQLISMIREEDAESSKSRYLEALGEIDEEERIYLKERYHLDIPMKIKNQCPDSNFKQKVRNYSGRLITYRGSNQLFQTLVHGIVRQKKKPEILLIDGDLLKPTFDEIFGIKHITTKEKSYLTGRDNTGLNIALDLMKRKTSIDDIIEKTTVRLFRFGFGRKMFHGGKIRLMLGNYNIYNYENYNLSLLQTLISAMLQRFDFVIVRLSNELHDEFSMSMVHRGDFNIIAIRNLKSEIRYFAQVYDMLVVRQDIDKNKICVLKGYSLPDGVFPHLFKNSYRGNIKKITSIIRRL